MYPFEDPTLIRQSILETDGGFRDRRAGELGILLITRRFDDDVLLAEKGKDMPLGKRIL